MVLSGKLCLSHKDDSYTMFVEGRSVNLSDYLDALLLEQVRFKVVQSYDGGVLLDVSGKLYKNKIQPKYYTWHVENEDENVDIDSMLWDLVGSKLIIELKNIS